MKITFTLLVLLILTGNVLFGQQNSRKFSTLTGSSRGQSQTEITDEKFEDTLDQQIVQKANDIARRITIIDCHNHNLFQLPSETKPKQVAFSMLKKSGVKGIVQSFPVDRSKIKNPSEDILNEMRDTKKEIEDDSMKASVVLKSGDFISSPKNDTVAIMIEVEYFQGIFSGNVGLVKKYYQEGVREIGLVRIGGADSVFLHDNLTQFGIDLIKEFNRLGIICDITHLPASAQKKIIEISRSPVILSHTATYSMVNSEFNATDSTLEKLTAKGGIIGISFYSGQLSVDVLAELNKGVEWNKISRANIEELVNHIDYLKKKVGIDFIGIGSDYGGSGQMAPGGLETIEGFPLIIYHLLKRGYTENEIEKVMGLNFIRFFERVEQKAALK